MSINDDTSSKKDDESCEEEEEEEEEEEANLETYIPSGYHHRNEEDTVSLNQFFTSIYIYIYYYFFINDIYLYLCLQELGEFINSNNLLVWFIFFDWIFMVVFRRIREFVMSI